MMRRKLIAGLAMLALAGLSATACGDGETTEEDATVDNDTMEEMDTGVEDDSTMETDGPDGNSDDRDGGMDEDGNGSGDDCAKCVADEFKDDTVRNCSDNADERPARCDTTPQEYSDWGPGSVVTSLELTTEEAKDCCFNIDGSDDGSNDNKLVSILSYFSGIGASIGESMYTGEIVILNEHQDLTSLDQDEEFAVNFFLGEYGSQSSTDYLQKTDSECTFGEETNCELEGTSGEDFLINPESLDEGTHPQAQVEPATITDAEVGAGPGRVVLNLSVPEIGNISLDINGAKIEATVDEEASNLNDQGVVITKGKLGGYVLIEDVLDLLNQLFSNCGCLGNPEQALVGYETEEGDPDIYPDACARENPPEGECTVSCTEMVQDKAGSCDGGSGLVCEQAGLVCGLTNVLNTIRDLDVDGDGQVDAVSIGAIFETAGANIEGVADYVAASDQQVSSGEVTVDRVFANESGWLAIYSDSSLGSENLLGSTELQAGLSEDVTVPVSGLSSEQDVWAVLHTDDGSDSFEADSDPLVKHYPEMSGSVSTVFHVTP